MNIQSINKLTLAVISRYGPGRRQLCANCQQRCRFFLPYRQGEKSRAPLARALRIVGSEVDHFECPWCGSTDRERHLLLYLSAHPSFRDTSDWRIVHFAPEKHLSTYVESLGFNSYEKCDLFPVAADIQQVDLTAMPFADQSVDLLIANHVLEHVADDYLATEEVFRVLAPGGYAILQTPYSPVLEHTWSDPGITSEEMRFHAHGQEDHVRTFGRDIFERFARCGLTPKIQHHRDLLAEYDCARYGVNCEEPFFLFQRPASPAGQ